MQNALLPSQPSLKLYLLLAVVWLFISILVIKMKNEMFHFVVSFDNCVVFNNVLTLNNHDSLHHDLCLNVHGRFKYFFIFSPSLERKMEAATWKAVVNSLKK